MLYSCRIIEWPTTDPSPLAEFVKTVGEYMGIETGISAILSKNGLQSHTLDFDSSILTELDEKYGTSGEKWEVPAEELTKRRDFRETQIFSIDPYNARDLDDALHIRSLNDTPHLGLLQGLRICRRWSWGPVHVAGTNAVGVRQQETRRPPKVAALKKAFWVARRTADAVGVASWSTLPRECNRTTHEIMKEMRTTQQGVSWTAREATPKSSKWTAIIACADTDIRAWLNERTEQQQAAAGSGAA
ncbi:hypothetical protein PRIC2_007191 [Phytophthora ramorum]